MKPDSSKDQVKPVAAGDYDYLEARATRKEKKSGDFTKVTRLSMDEADPS